MPINNAALNVKLGAILAKDAGAIRAAGVRIPHLLPGYTLAELQAWLAARSDLLADFKAKQYTDNQINNIISNRRATLGAADQVIADQIIAGQPYDLGQASSDSAYTTLVLLVLIKFVTTFP